jgi:hypothetical protein
MKSDSLARVAGLVAAGHAGYTKTVIQICPSSRNPGVAVERIFLTGTNSPWGDAPISAEVMDLRQVDLAANPRFLISIETQSIYSK